MRVERTKLYHKQINTYKMRKRFGGGGGGVERQREEFVLLRNSGMTSNHNFDRVSSILRLRYIISLRLRSHHRETVRYEWVGTLYKRNTYPNLCQPTRPLASNQLPLLSSLPLLLTLLLRDCILERYSHYLQSTGWFSWSTYSLIMTFYLDRFTYISWWAIYRLIQQSQLKKDIGIKQKKVHVHTRTYINVRFTINSLTCSPNKCR